MLRSDPTGLRLEARTTVLRPSRRPLRGLLRTTQGGYLALPVVAADRLDHRVGDDARRRLAAALAGSIGIAPTANINPEGRYPSMFEPIHGSAFDITGKGVANPVGTFWSATMMLEHMGETAAAQRLMRAIERVTGDPALHTPDLGGQATTRIVTDAMIETIRGDNG